MPESDDDPPTRVTLSDEIRDLACKLHWFDMKAGGEQKALSLCQRLIDTVTEYESVLRQDMREAGIAPRPPLVIDEPFPDRPDDN